MCVEICSNCEKAMLVRCDMESHKDQRARWNAIRPVYKCSCAIPKVMTSTNNNTASTINKKTGGNKKTSSKFKVSQPLATSKTKSVRTS